MKINVPTKMLDWMHKDKNRIGRLLVIALHKIDTGRAERIEREAFAEMLAAVERDELNA